MDYLLKILDAIIVAAVIWFLKKAVDKLVDYFLMKAQGFNLTGCWYSEHGSYISSDIHALEITYIWHEGEKIKYRMEQYVNFDDKKRIFCGKGVLRAGVISSYYYAVDKHSKLVGCLNLQVMTKTASDVYLSGSFYEVDERKKKHNFKNYPDDYYKMYQLPLNSKRKLRVMFLKEVFNSYSEAVDYVSRNK